MRAVVKHGPLMLYPSLSIRTLLNQLHPLSSSSHHHHQISHTHTFLIQHTINHVMYIRHLRRSLSIHQSVATRYRTSPHPSETLSPTSLSVVTASTSLLPNMRTYVICNEQLRKQERAGWRSCGVCVQVEGVGKPNKTTSILWSTFKW